MNPAVRSADAADIDYMVASNVAMARETEARDLDPALLRRGIERMVADPTLGRYFIAEDAASSRLGTIALTWEWSDWRCGRFYWIQNVWVEPEARRAGVFRAMYAHVEQVSDADPDSCGLRLYVERENERAMGTYLALGMEETVYRLFEKEVTRRA